jgi:CDP-4-dehydro-6-deoxyglucose reductase
MFSIKATSGKSFPQLEQETILNAAEKSDVVIAYSCRTGRCSTCKCKVISGDTVPLVDEVGLSQKEKDDGWILTCVRSATTNLELEIEDLGDVILPKAALFPCRINSIDRVSKDVARVFLRLPPTASFKILPGQYVDIIGPSDVKRSYSVANHVTDNILEFHIRKVENGSFSRYWFEEAKINDLLRLNGPLGTFFLRDIKGQDLVFLATGTGIAPIKAIIESVKFLPPEEHPNSISVFWGGRTLDDFYFEPLADFKLFRYVPALSRPDTDWKGHMGYVQDVFLNEHPDLSNCVVYCCGSDIMIKSAKKALLENGLTDERFLSDAFLPSMPQ